MIATTVISIVLFLAGVYYLLVASVANSRKFIKSVEAWLVMLLAAYLYSIDPLRVAKRDYEISKLTTNTEIVNKIEKIIATPAP